MLRIISLNFTHHLMVLCLSFNIFLPRAQELLFNYPNFNGAIQDYCYGNAKGICLLGNATKYENGVIELTGKNASNECGLMHSIGAAVFSEPIQLWSNVTKEAASFQTRFRFKIIYNCSFHPYYGDGLAFFISRFPISSSDISKGGYLGLVSKENEVNQYNNNSFLAMEVDTYLNEKIDTSHLHMGIDVNSIRSLVHMNFTDDQLIGSVVTVQMDYNSTTSNLSLSIESLGLTNPAKLSSKVYIREILDQNVSIGFISTTGDFSEQNQIMSWEFSYTKLSQVVDGVNPNFTSAKKRLVIIVLVSILAFLSVCCALGISKYISKEKNKKMMKGDQNEEYDDTDLDNEFEDRKYPRKFSYAELVTATDNFNENGKLGEGGFGAVYKGFLKDLNINVAVKRISGQSQQGRKEYIAEVKIISQLRHKNLVQLIGWCHLKDMFIIVYELIENGSLDSHIFDTKKSLAWSLRFNIVRGLASALQYLHDDGPQCIVHRDIKCGNVMLDKSLNAKLGDFGLARLSEHGSGLQTTFMAGTMGYMAPECFNTGKCSKESDVYSFGIVALEIACGRKCIENCVEEEKSKLLDWVWTMHGKRKLLEVIDTRLLINDNHSDEEQIQHLMIVGLWCAHPDATQRPSMSQAIAVLKYESPLPNLPPRMPVPLFATSRFLS